MRRCITSIVHFLSCNWFLLGIALAVGIAAALPELGRTRGWLRSEYTVQFGCVSLMFLCSGMSLKTKVLLHALSNLPIHLLIQTISFGITPIVGWLVSLALKKGPINKLLVQGLVVATCMPTTVAGNIIYTKQAGGNDAVALTNAVIGNTLGVFISPALLLLYLGASGQAPFEHVLFILGLTVLVPLAVGQVMQFLLPCFVIWLTSKMRFDIFGHIMILLLVWSSFCNVFAQKIKIDTVSIATIIFLDMALYLSFMALCISLAYVRPLMRLLGLKRSDVIAIMFVGSTKTVALGFPLVSAVYGGSPHTTILVTPLLIYQAEQNFIGGLLLRPLRRWREEEEDALPVIEKSHEAGGHDMALPDKPALAPVSSSLTTVKPSALHLPGLPPPLEATPVTDNTVMWKVTGRTGQMWFMVIRVPESGGTEGPV